jgi:hypothetical protein
MLDARCSLLVSRYSLLVARQIMDDLIPICRLEGGVLIGSTRRPVLDAGRSEAEIPRTREYWILDIRFSLLVDRYSFLVAECLMWNEE